MEKEWPNRRISDFYGEHNQPFFNECISIKEWSSEISHANVYCHSYLGPSMFIIGPVLFGPCRAAVGRSVASQLKPTSEHSKQTLAVLVVSKESVESL